MIHGIGFPTMLYVRPAKAQTSLRIHAIWSKLYAQADQSLCSSLEYSMNIKLLTEHHLEFLSLKGCCTGLSESTGNHVSRLKNGMRMLVWTSITHRWETNQSHEFFFRIVPHKIMPYAIKAFSKNIWAATCDFQQCGILTSIDSDEPV